jgi:hypothetical protein
MQMDSSNFYNTVAVHKLNKIGHLFFSQLILYQNRNSTGTLNWFDFGTDGTKFIRLLQKCGFKV